MSIPQNYFILFFIFLKKEEEETQESDCVTKGEVNNQIQTITTPILNNYNVSKVV